MVTDIYGGIEVRHPSAGQDWYDDEPWGEPWVKALDLHPLLEEGGPAGTYPEFAFLFGARNTYGFEPIAAARGLPDDVSQALRAHLGSGIDAGELAGATWVEWREIAGLDLAGPFGPFSALLTGVERQLRRLTLLTSDWREAAIVHTAPPPLSELTDITEPVTWKRGAVDWTVQPVTLGTFLGEGTPWGHTFAVMRALAGRFGDDRVRLVVAFD